MNAQARRITDSANRRSFIGGSDARIIMGEDEAALLRLWREKRGEVEPEDLSGNLIVQLGLVTEPLNRIWYERNTGQVLTDVQRRTQHPVIRYMAATLDGMVEATGAVFEAKFMLPWSFSEEGAAEKYMPQLQHNMWVTNAKTVGALDHHRWRQMGRDHDPRRPPVSAPDLHRRKEVLALRRVRRATSPLRGRAAAAADRGGADRRHGLIQFLGGIRGCSLSTRPAFLEHDGPRPNSRAWCQRMPRRRSATASAPSAPNRARSASICSRWRRHAAVQ